MPLVLLALTVFLLASVVIAVVGGFAGPVLFIRNLLNRGSMRMRPKWMRAVLWTVLLLATAVLYPVSCLLFWVPGSCILTFNFLRRMM